MSTSEIFMPSSKIPSQKAENDIVSRCKYWDISKYVCVNKKNYNFSIHLV